MSKIVRQIEPFLARNFEYCDIGARGGMEEPWDSFRDIIDLIGFEPEKREYDLLCREKSSRDKIYPYALSSKNTDLSLYITKKRGCSSLYKPNYTFLENFPNVDRFEIEETVSVETTYLDSLYENKALSNMDFLKVDVQGAELEILQGGEKFLSEKVLGVQVEVEFQSLYANQPLFSDIDSFITNNLGLQLQDLKKSYWKHPEGINIGATKGQLICADALYFRSPHEMMLWCSNFQKDEASNKIQMACLMGIAYGYLDYVLCLLKQPTIVQYLEKDKISQWQNLIIHHGKSLSYQGKGAGRLAVLFNLLYRMVQPSHEGWASIGQQLGSKKKFGLFY